MTRRLLGSIVVATLLGVLLAMTPMPSAQAVQAPPSFTLGWGTAGTGDGQFNGPQRIAVDADGNAYVADTGSNRIQVFDADGSYVTQWGADQLDRPHGVAIDPTGALYVADTYHHRIVRFTTTGTILGEWGALGSGDGQFTYPHGVAVDAAGAVYVADTGNNRIQKFDSTGTYVAQWGSPGAGPGQFNSPYGVATGGPTGDVVVTDTFNNRVQVFSSDGTYLRQWGGAGELNSPQQAAVDGAGNVYVTDTSGQRMRGFDPTGRSLTDWGTYGAAEGQFFYPSGVAVDGRGRIYVSEVGNNRVQVFTPATVSVHLTADETTIVAGLPIHYHLRVTNSGSAPLTGLTVTDPTAPACAGPLADVEPGATATVDCSYTTTRSEIGVHRNTATVTWTGAATGTTDVVDVAVTAAPQSEAPPVFVRSWGSAGTDDGQFSAPAGIAVAASGTVYVADRGNSRIQRFTATGTYLGQWGSNGSGNGQFVNPSAVAVDPTGDVYVADRGNHRVQKFTATGTYVTGWGGPGTGDGQFLNPSAVAVDATGDVYVADSNNSRIQKFTGTGTYLTQWGSNGHAAGQFVSPAGIAIDPSGNVYVAENRSNRVQKFTGTGGYLDQWGNTGTANGQFRAPNGLAADASGAVYVTETSNRRIQKFSGGGTFLTVWGSSGAGTGQFASPLGTATGPDGTVYVADTSNNRVQQFAYDATDPTVDLRTPAADQAFPLGATATADYSCDDTGGAGLDTCTGTIADGDPIDTSAPGDHTFTVTATDRAANTTTVTHHYTVSYASRLEGTVTETGTGTPLEGPWVVALRTADYHLVGGAVTDASGHYGIDVDPGGYYLEFVDPELSHVIEWYADHRFDQLGSADPVTVGAGTTTSVDAALDDPTGAVAGTITEAGTGTPLDDAVVAVLKTGESQPFAATRTDPAGHYRLRGLPVGDYLVVSALAAGTHRPWFSGDTPNPNLATHVAISQGATATADIALPPMTGTPPTATIAGTVTDDVSDDAQPGMLVGALRAADFGFVAATFTDGDGGYRLDVPDGAYYLEFFDLDHGHHFEWYDDEPDPIAATPTPVTASATADAALTPLRGTVAGTVTDDDGRPITQVWVAVIGTDDGQPVAGSTTDDAGRYTIADVDIGDYYLIFVDAAGRHALEYHDGAPLIDTAAPITVLGSQTTRIDAALTPTS